jgi:arsenate reductase (glutaredoxin)
MSEAEITIYHNPVCSKSRGALAMLHDQPVEFEVIEYLVTPPSRGRLQSMVEKLVGPVSELVRTGDKRFQELGLDKHAYDAPDAVIDLLIEHPELMERPVVVRGDRAVIGRPNERLLELLACSGARHTPPRDPDGPPNFLEER